jgi:hypothetical protein
MHYYLDAEFNGFGGALISLALVPKGRLLAPFYQALPCPSPVPWVVEHVLPVLRTETISRSQMSVKLSSYLCGDPEPVIVADWPEDIAQLSRMAATVATADIRVARSAAVQFRDRERGSSQRLPRRYRIADLCAGIHLALTGSKPRWT